MLFSEKITPDERWLLSIVLALAIGTLLLLVLFMRNGYLTQFDQTVLHWFHKMKSPTLDHFFSAITWLGSLWILLPLYIILTLLLSQHFEHFEKILGIGFWGSVLTAYALKYELDRKRPHFFPTINELPIDPSFPSAHTAQVVAFTLLLWLIVYHGYSLLGNVLTGTFVLIALGVAASRMYLQVHYPSDVLAGGLIAIIWSCISVWIVKSGALT
ncbi:MAG: phosphatase PAP2 family protein [Sulfuricurvum sp.]|nr:phosphatase PAP2 family protein [Sulfuricurvum sp.]